MPHVLVINDEPDLLEAIALVLEPVGLEVTTLDHAECAVEVTRSVRPDVILLDWVMPGVGGREVLQNLRRSELGSIPVVVMSALPDLRNQALNAGAVAFLPKPFDVEDAVRAIELAAQGKGARVAV